jgi:hypothetical protein
MFSIAYHDSLARCKMATLLQWLQLDFTLIFLTRNANVHYDIFLVVKLPKISALRQFKNAVEIIFQTAFF